MVSKYLYTLFLCYIFNAVYAHDEFYLISVTDKYVIKFNKNLCDNKYRYEIKKTGIEQEKVQFVSSFNYTSGYLCDEVLILTNNNTCESPCLFVWDFKKKILKEDKLLISTEEHFITTYQRSRVRCMEDGSCTVHDSIIWHNDCWYKTPYFITLRLGDSVPNRCKIAWFYYIDDGMFSVKDCSYSKESSSELLHKQVELKNELE